MKRLTAPERRAAEGIAAFLRSLVAVVSTRIWIGDDGEVTIENLTPEMVGVGIDLNPDDRRLRMIAALQGA